MSGSSSNTSLNNLTPRMYNTDYIKLREATRSTISSTGTVSDASYENFILYNLAKDISPVDISINRFSMPKDLSLNLNDTNIKLTSPYDQADLVDHVLFNNDDSFIQSEKFAMNVKYSSGSGSTAKTDEYRIAGPNSKRILSNVQLTNLSAPLYDSNLKMEFTLNNNTQFSTPDNLNNRWRVDINRSFNNMNYFAAINSHLNTVGGVYPFSILPDLSTNQYSLAAETDTIPAVYFTASSNIAQRAVTRFVDTDISMNTLAANGLKIIVDNTYTDYDGSEFKTYKITQSDSGVGLLIQILNNNTFINGANLPIGQWSNGNDIQDGGSWLTIQDISKNIATLDPSNPAKVNGGFTATLTVGNVNLGGYSATTSLFSLDDTKLTTDGSPENLNYFNNHKALGNHYVDICNGYVKIKPSSNPNASFVSVSDSEETLDSSFCNISGKVILKKTIPDCSGVSNSARVSFLYDLSSDKVTPTGNRSALTNKVSVYNSAAEFPSSTYANGQSYVVLDNTLATVADVSYSVKVLVESTGNSNSNSYDALDARNLALNTKKSNSDAENARLVIANPNKPISFDIRSATSFKLLEEDSQDAIRKDAAISILSIKNTCNLVNDGSLCSGLNNDGIDISYSTVVPGALCSVNLIDSDISTLNYYDYRVVLQSKTARDLSNSLTPTNNWSFGLTTLENDRFGIPADVSGFLIGNPQRVSELIYNDAEFLRGNNPIDIDYTFSVSPLTTSLNSIRYNFDASLTDPTRGNNTSFSYKFGGSTDITFDNIIDFSDINLGQVTSGITGSSNYPTSGYIFEKWLRRRQYKAQINPSFPFYENLLLKTDTVNEEIVYYRAWTKSSDGLKSFEVSSLILKQFSLSNGTTLDNVDVKLVDKFLGVVSGGTLSVQRSNPTTRISLKPSDCCIFLASLQGKDLSNNRWQNLGYDASNQIWLTNRADIDPFIKQSGTISNYHAGNTNFANANFSCLVNVVFPILNNLFVVKSPNYYIGVTNRLGVNTSITANLYSFNYNQVTSNSTLANYFTSSFSPYNNNFDNNLNTYKSSTVYSCDLSLNNNVYTLTVSHRRADVSYTDLFINFPNDYVLNFNIVCSPYNLLSTTKYATGSAPVVSYDNLTSEGLAGSTNRIIKVDNGVYLTLENNVTYGMEEKFALNKDSVNVQFVNNGPKSNGLNDGTNAIYDPSNGNFYRNNNTDWCDISGKGQTAVIKYKPIIFNNANNLTVSNGGSSNKTKSIIFNRVRGYNMQNTNNEIEIERSPASYTFVLDVSYTIPQHIDMSNGLPVYVKITDPSRGLLVYGPPSNWSDNSKNDVTLLYNRAATGDLSANYTKRIIIDASSNWSVYNDLQNQLDPSYNYKYERQIYKQIHGSGVSRFNINDLVSTGTISDETGGFVNTVRQSDGKIHLNVGLIVNPTRSILSNSEQASNALIPINLQYANYSYSFYNTLANSPAIINGDGSGNLAEGIITNFMNLKSRAIKANSAFTVKVVYTGTLIRVYSADTYTTKPSEITDWVQLPTSPFTQQQIATGLAPISLNPSVYNGPFNLKLQKVSSKLGDFTSYFVCAPPCVRIRYNPISKPITSLPFTFSPVTSDDIYFDIKSNRVNDPDINLRSVVGNLDKVPDDVIIKRPYIDFNAYRTMAVIQNNPYNFIINGNNMKLSLYSGISAPQQTPIVVYVDGSLNITTDPTDVSYSYTIFTDSSNQLVEFPDPDNINVNTTIIFNQPINYIENKGNLYKVVRSGVGYDISLCQPVTQFLQGITNNNFNINFTIDNAFIPPNTSYLPLITSKSSSVTFYDSTCRFNNGKYYVFLNKYIMNSGTDYQSILSNNTNVSAVSFMIEKIQQKALELFTDGSNIHFLINSTKELIDNRNRPKMVVDNIRFDDLNGQWTQVGETMYKNVGITLSAIDASGINAIRNLLIYDITRQINQKTLFIERSDIFRISSAFGEPVFRITNSGNVITPKVTASVLSLFQQSVTTQDLFPGLKTASTTDDQLYLTDNAKTRGLYSQNTLDFSGNVLVTSQVAPSV